MKEIFLTKGKIAIVDDGDYDNLVHHEWSAYSNGYGWYARATINGKTVTMHRFVLDYYGTLETDHINGNGLDNRRNNLRLATTAENQFNRGPQKNNASGCKGIDWYPRHQAWRARIQAYKRPIFLGYYPSLNDAASAYREAAAKFHGEFARTNSEPTGTNSQTH